MKGGGLIKKIDLIGKRFGDLTVIEEDIERIAADRERFERGEIKRVKQHWVCVCVCGKMISVSGDNLRSGNSTSCGCKKGERMSSTFKKRNDVVYVEGLKCHAIIASNTLNEFLIDSNAVDLTSRYCWYETNYGYLMTRDPETGRQMLLHRFLALGLDGLNNNISVDHINRNKRDNRSSNLRACVDIENSRNRSKSKRNTSGATGVSYDHNTHKWRAYVNVDYHYISLGYYDNYNDAVQARKRGETEYYGDFAPQ